MRFLVLLVATCALGAVLWLVMAGDAPSRSPLPELPTSTDESPHAPTEEESGNVPAGLPDARERGDIQVLVLGENGKPQSDVEVVCRTSESQLNKPKTRRARAIVEWRSAMASTKRPRTRELVEVARARTNAQGRVTFRNLPFTLFELNGVVAPPGTVSHQNAYVSWFNRSPQVTLKVVTADWQDIHLREANTNKPATALVRVSREHDRWKMNSLAWWSKIHVEGESRLLAPVGGRYSAVVYADPDRKISGYAMESKAGEPWIIRLPAGRAEIAGSVLDESGRAVPHAEICLEIITRQGTRETDPLKTTQTTHAGSDGHFRLAGLPPGRLARIGAWKDGFQPKWVSWSDAERPHLPDNELFEVPLTLVRSGSISGSVTIRGDEPLAEANVIAISLHRHDASKPWHSAEAHVTQTTERGRYRLEGLPLGRFILVAQHPSAWYPPVAAERGRRSSAWLNGTYLAPEQVSVVLRPADRHVSRDLELRRSASVRGRVVDPAGHPVANAAVWIPDGGLRNALAKWGVTTLPGLPSSRVATTDADGSFETSAIPLGEHIQLVATFPGLVGKPCEPFSLADESGSPPPLSLLLQPGASLQGRVVDADGAPLAGISVNRSSLRRDARPARSIESTDWEGKFSIFGVPEGDHELDVGGMHREYHFDSLRVRDVRPGETRTGLQLQARRTYKVTGRLVLPDGRPAADVSLIIRPVRTEDPWSEEGRLRSYATTNREGRFAFDTPFAGEVEIKAMHEHSLLRVPIGSSFTSPVQNIELVYTPPEEFTFRLRIVGPDGKPVPRCSVQCGSRVYERRLRWSRFMTTVDGGTGFVTVADPFPVELRVDAPRNEWDEPLNMSPHQETLDAPPSGTLEIRLAAGKELRGRVVDASGSPISKIGLTISPLHVRTSANGTFHFQGLERKERYELQVAREAPWVPRKPIEVAGETQDFEIRLVRAETIKGRIVGPEGHPIESASIRATWDPIGDYRGGLERPELSRDGRFEIGGLPKEARVEIEVKDAMIDESHFLSKTLEDVRAGTRDLEIRLARGYTVAGRVVTAAGRPAAGARVRAELPDRLDAWGDCDEHGYFKIHRLPRGKLKLKAKLAKERLRTDAVEVEAGSLELVLRLLDTVSLRLEVEGADGQALFGTLTPRDKHARHPALLVSIEKDGPTIVDYLPRGVRYDLRVSTDEYLFEALDLEPGPTVHRVTAHRR